MRSKARGNMLTLEDGDPGSTGHVGATLRGIADTVAMEEVHDVAWEFAPRSIAEGDAVDALALSRICSRMPGTRRDSNMGSHC